MTCSLKMIDRNASREYIALNFSFHLALLIEKLTMKVH